MDEEKIRRYLAFVGILEEISATNPSLFVNIHFWTFDLFDYLLVSELMIDQSDTNTNSNTKFHFFFFIFNTTQHNKMKQHTEQKKITQQMALRFSLVPSHTTVLSRCLFFHNHHWQTHRHQHGSFLLSHHSLSRAVVVESRACQCVCVCFTTLRACVLRPCVA